MDMTAIIVALISLFGMIWQSYHNGKMVKQNDLKKELEALHEKLDIIGQSQEYTLQERMLHLCKQYLRKESITVNELKLITNLYNSYHKLGGNDFITGMFDRVQRLPIEEDED